MIIHNHLYFNYKFIVRFVNEYVVIQVNVIIMIVEIIIKHFVMVLVLLMMMMMLDERMMYKDVLISCMTPINGTRRCPDWVKMKVVVVVQLSLFPNGDGKKNSRKHVPVCIDNVVVLHIMSWEVMKVICVWQQYATNWLFQTIKKWKIWQKSLLKRIHFVDTGLRMFLY